MQKILMAAGIFLGTVIPKLAWSQSHAMIDRSRSSEVNNFYIFQSIEGELGKIRKKEQGSEYSNPLSWKGLGVRNGMGIEVFRFTQFAVSHTMLNIRSKENGLENMRGSRLAGEMNFAFSAPVTNIQFGMGYSVAQMEYQNMSESDLFVGTGPYYSAGLNYFMSPSFSLQILGKKFQTHYTKTGGSSSLEELQGDFNNLSFGLNIWL